MDPGVDVPSVSAPVVEADTGGSGLVEGTKAFPADVGGAEATGAEGVGWNAAGSGVCGAVEGEEVVTGLKGAACAADADAADVAVAGTGLWLIGAETGCATAGGTETGMTDSC